MSSYTDHPLVQLTLCRVREFLREPEAVFWVFVFPIPRIDKRRLVLKVISFSVFSTGNLQPFTHPFQLASYDKHLVIVAS